MQFGFYENNFKQEISFKVEHECVCWVSCWAWPTQPQQKWALPLYRYLGSNYNKWVSMLVLLSNEVLTVTMENTKWREKEEKSMVILIKIRVKSNSSLSLAQSTAKPRNNATPKYEYRSSCPQFFFKNAMSL